MTRVAKAYVCTVNVVCPNCDEAVPDNDGCERVIPEEGKTLTCDSCGCTLRLPKWVMNRA